MGGPEGYNAAMAVDGSIGESATAAIDDAEWEYEYDENETEDYYFTLDLTTLQIETVLRAEKVRRSQSSNTKSNAEYLARDEQPTEVASADATPTPIANEESGTPVVFGKPSQLQVLELHTANPFIKLDNSFYSCHWSTELGTQFYVARPGVADEPLRPGHVVDVIGLSRAKLMGGPVSLRRREREPAGASVSNAIGLDDDDEDVDIVADTPDDVLAHTTRASKDPAVWAQASFLGRLSAIKKRKGDTDTVPLEGVKEYRVPDNKDEIRERALAADRQRDINAGLKVRQPPKKRRPRQLLNSQNAAKGGARSAAEIRASLGFTDRRENSSADHSPEKRSMAGVTTNAAQSMSKTGYAALPNQQSPNVAAYGGATPDARPD